MADRRPRERHVGSELDTTMLRVIRRLIQSHDVPETEVLLTSFNLKRRLDLKLHSQRARTARR